MSAIIHSNGFMAGSPARRSRSARLAKEAAALAIALVAFALLFAATVLLRLGSLASTLPAVKALLRSLGEALGAPL